MQEQTKEIRMDKTVLAYAGISLLGVFIGAVSQVMLKKAALKQYDTKLQEYMNPLVISAYVLFVGTTLMSIVAYKVIPLSMGPILEETSYIYVTFFGVKIFKEKMNRQKVVALGFIVLGIGVYALCG